MILSFQQTKVSLILDKDGKLPCYICSVFLFIELCLFACTVKCLQKVCGTRRVHLTPAAVYLLATF